MRNYKFTEEGIPLISYLPDANDIVPTPSCLEIDLCDSGECDGYFGINNWNRTQLYEAEGATEREITSRLDHVLAIMRNWREEAAAKGHKYVDITYDNSKFYCVYYRPATLTEHVGIKRQAEIEIKYSGDYHKEYLESVANAKKLLGIEDENNE